MVVLLALVVALLAGATYQGVATALERRDYPPPGQKIDVGGHQLHIRCTGEGHPVVILEAPAAGMSAAWARVQAGISPRTRVCSYDRAGLGWSEAGDEPYDPALVPEQLHLLLAGAKIERPVVLVGHSLGAAFAALYAHQYPEDVAALLLLDAPVEDGGGMSTVELDGFVRLVRYSPWLARAGVLRAMQLLSSGAAGLPEPASGAAAAFLNRPDHLTRAGIELSKWRETVALASAGTPSARFPIVEVRTGTPQPGSFLSHQTSAEPVTLAILTLVARVSSR